MMAVFAALVLGGGAIFAVVVGWRWLDATSWRQALVALRLGFPRDLTAENVSEWLAMLGSLRVPLVLETWAEYQAISHYLLVPGTRQAEVVAATQTVIPGARCEAVPDYLSGMSVSEARTATELRLTHWSHSLAADRAETAVAALLAALSQVSRSERVLVQWCVVGMATPRPRRAGEGARELAQAEKVKHSQPMLQAVGRVAVMTPRPGRAGALVGRVAGTFRLLDAPGVAVVRRSVPIALVRWRVQARALPLAVWPVIVNASEAAGLVGVPIGKGTSVPGLALARARHLPPGEVPSTGGTPLAVSNHLARAGQPLVLTPDDRLRHVYAVGPTGVGKSNLLAGMAIQDAANGHGLCLIDPKADLVETVLARLPAEAAERVIVLDLSRTDQPVGFNPLHVPGAGEHARELAVDRVLHIFKDLYKDNWGPRSDDLLRATLQTLASVPAPNGSAFTICEAPELMSNPGLRQYATARPELSPALKVYWAGFDALSPTERSQHAGPVLNKLRAFTMRTATRLLLGQSTGLDLARVMAERRVLLVTLAKGTIGEETAQLAGSLLIAALWQAVQSRVSVAPAERRPFFLFADEFQDVVRLSESLPDLLAQARGLGVGAVLANQYLAQLPEVVRTAVLGTVRSQVVFQVEHDDARLLEQRFAPDLTAADLSGLGRYEVALRLCVNGQIARPATGTTQPLGDPIRDAAVLAQAALARWGRTRAEVEQGLAARVRPASSEPRRTGRVPRGRSS